MKKRKRKNREISKPSTLESFANHIVHRQKKKLLTEPSGSCDHSFSILESKGHSLKAVYIYIYCSPMKANGSKRQPKKRNKHTLLRVIPTMTLSICYWHIFWHIFWHSIWHIFWHSTWHIFWHMFWHIFWHSIWHIFWHIF